VSLIYRFTSSSMFPRCHTLSVIEQGKLWETVTDLREHLITSQKLLHNSKKKLYSYFSVHFTSTILQDTEISVFMISTSFKIGVICGIFFVINDKRYDGFIIVNNDNMYYLGCLVLLSNYYCR
jgi:hypothetical protein